MLVEERLKRFTEENYKKTLTKVNDRIYHFLGFAHSNATAIIGDSSVILVDTLDSDECAKELKTELLKITDKPVKTIIYTHGHPDHRGGAGAFRETAEEIIAFAPQKPILKYYERLNDILGKRGTFQHGYGLNDEEAICQGIGIREGKEIGKGKYDFLNPTTIYNEKEVERVIDGVRLKLVSAVGESDDQIFIWLEEDRVICTGDNYYGCWPNLYAIRGTQYRDIAAWIDSLNVILSYDSVALLPGHTKPLIGYDLIQDQVGTFRDAIEYVLLQTLDCMNRGMTMSEAVEHVKLPPKFADKDYLGEYYGTVEWSVKSVYSGYLGWFDGDPAKLMPVSDREFNDTLLEMIGVEKLLNKIMDCMESEDYQLALQLLELTGENELKREALFMRARQMTSANARHYLIACSKVL
ncbi:MAG: alkyl/aryl-sulfatase [Youngiibacter sp.]|nr:alkyl/aryl-sulfatase [Youngiibacter sp.]